jgi:hypothetical protein
MPERDREGRLTRAGMEEVIREGGSVLHNGEVHTDLQRLPSSVDLARGDAVRERQERDRLLGHRAALDAQLAQLGPGPGSQPDPSQSWSVLKPDAADAHETVQEIERLRRENDDLRRKAQEQEEQRQNLTRLEDASQGREPLTIPPLQKPEEPRKGKGK